MKLENQKTKEERWKVEKIEQKAGERIDKLMNE
jgi:hypothetical protein